MNTNTSTAIHTRALLVVLTISTWTARKYDRAASQQVTSNAGAIPEAGRFNKLLITGSDSYKALTSLSSSIRDWHYASTLAWSDVGRRLLPTANYMAYTTQFRDYQRQQRAALAAFGADYPAIRAAAPAKLGRLFCSADFPAWSDLESRFALAIEFEPLPAAGDIRVDLAADQVATIEASIAGRLDRAVGAAVSDAWQRLYDVTAKIAERLGNPDAIFRDSLIENARETCDVLRRLNVTDNPDLETMRARVADQLTAFDADTLRDRPAQRARVAAKADDILAAMSGLFSPKAAA